MRKPIALIFAAGLAPAILCGVTACNSGASGSQASAAEIPSATVAPATRGTITHTLNLAGQFQPYQVVDVHAKVSGYIRHIYVDIGDKVRQGQVLAVLEVPELSAQLKGTVAELARSRDEITRAEHELARTESEHSAVHADYRRLKQAAAAQPGLIAEQELDDAQSKDLSAEAQVDAAKASLAAAQQQADVDSANHERVGALMGYTQVTSPLNGVIIWRYADTGALIQAGTASDVQSLPVVKLSQSDLLRLRLPVPEDAVQYIHEGAVVQVRVDAVNRSFVGRVVRFTRDVSLATRTMETEIDVENRDLSLTPGMYANTKIELERRQNVLTVPVMAVVRNGNQASVLVVDARNHVELRTIATGLQGSNLVEVKSGLAEGDRVITGGQANYQPGETVRPVVRQLPTFDVNAEQSGGGE
ncbi:efflux RND transporter periplasmic adaptor subunit [Paracidobacterium acidisoli]|uniref:Efflux RND transporter periplasmic adaptor subunit n=1 Tax=Paracidobacterium acidisoli TaxID=2303751 RepID=A0A372IJA8_9BACT|nr:efflux RND transporter periplasmic adaptor subunit [Paracidobacterium acidisoli]MBT9333234.1 efflux RND transporter periplasmic adaptor subunit [Paracidobacterium acidisoli]